MGEEKYKRKFKRYSSGSACEIIFPSVAYKGIVIDYSEGACVVIENAPEVPPGTEINVKIPDKELEFKGEIAWVDKVDNHLKAGIRRLDRLKGNLRNFRLADVLMGTYRRAQTGILEITIGSTVKKICIDRGDVIFASSNNEDEHLGGHLLKKGKITLTELEKATRLMSTEGLKLGEILVKHCCLTPGEVAQEVRNHMEDIIVSLFPQEEGRFEFKEGPVLLDGAITLHSSTANIIFRGIKKISSFAFIKKMCPSIDDILNSSHNPLQVYQSLYLDYADKKILSYVNGLYPLERILSLSLSSNFTTLKTISALIAIGLVHVKEEDEAPVEFPVDEVFGEPEEALPEYPDMVNQMAGKYEYLGYYEILDVAKEASIDDIRKAYFGLIKQFHPDRHFSFHSHEIKDNLLKIVSHVAEAYEILSDPEIRKEYNEALSQKGTEKVGAVGMPANRKRHSE